MKRMGILPTAALLWALAVPSAFAQVDIRIGGMHQTGARLQGMGLSNFQTLDDSNIWINPAFINEHRNKVYGSLGTETTWTDYDGGGVTDKNHDGWGGVSFDTDLGTWGLYYGRPYYGGLGGMSARVDNPVDDGAHHVGFCNLPYYSQFGATSGGSIDGLQIQEMPPSQAPDSNIDLFYGKDLGQSLLGLRLNYNAYKRDGRPSALSAAVNNPTYQDLVKEYGALQSSREVNLVGGVFLKGPQIGVSAVVGFPSLDNRTVLRDSRTRTTTGSVAVETADLELALKSDGALDLGLYADKLLKVSDRSTLFITGFLQHQNHSARIVGASTRTYTVTPLAGASTTQTYYFAGHGEKTDEWDLFGLDAALNVNASPSTLLVGTVGIVYLSGELSLTNTMTDDVYTNASGIKTYSPNVPFGLGSYVATSGRAIGVVEEIRVRETVWDVPLNIAVEHKMARWLTTRVGVKKSLLRRTQVKSAFPTPYTKPSADHSSQPDTAATDFTESWKSVISPDLPATVSTGFTVNFTDTLALNAVLNYDVLFSGTYLASGNRTRDAFNTTADLTYTF